ncbi:uncharacterized protein LOC112528229 [Cynara cardunculus var. scolymus]|uniref:uncharacterized protein LOC112528229 n=1 Tax=Cynara cardunculus var. scolymus TaxID=59895 RepID=UPI000D62E34F|nr:uncharacterized protein LOC112528229 [Cynara cardunculus var. scolymus]
MAEYEGFSSGHDHNNEGTTTSQKYGGLAPKKKPLISKDHERAFFDSADWALCKQGAGVNQKSTTTIETLQPKLQRTPHQRLPPRRPACVSRRDHHTE